MNERIMNETTPFPNPVLSISDTLRLLNFIESHDFQIEWRHLWDEGEAGEGLEQYTVSIKHNRRRIKSVFYAWQRLNQTYLYTDFRHWWSDYHELEADNSWTFHHVLSIMNSVLLEDKTVLNLIGAQVICIADITIRKYIEEEVLSRTNKELSNE